MPPIPYEPLATGDDDKSLQHAQARAHTARVKRILFTVLSLCAVMVAGFQGLRAIVRSSAGFLHTAPCAQRNLSSLPSHHTLPSGDKIPSVALGTAASSVMLCALCLWLRCAYQVFGRQALVRSGRLSLLR